MIKGSKAIAILPFLIGTNTSAAIDENSQTIYNENVRKDACLDRIVGLPTSGKLSTLVDFNSLVFHRHLLDNEKRKKERDRNMVDTRFWVSEKAEQETEDMSELAMTYTTKYWDKVRSLSEDMSNRLIDKLYENYQLPGIMEMSVEEVLNLPDKQISL